MMDGRLRVALLPLVLLMVGAPLAFDAARTASFAGSKALHPRAAGPYPAQRNPAYYDDLVHDSALQQYMRTVAGARSSVYEDASFRARGRNTIVLTVRAETPARARRFAEVLARQVVLATRRQFAFRAALDVKDLRQEIAGPVLGRPERRVLERKLRKMRRLRAVPKERLVVGAGGGEAARLTHWADRLANALPGDLPPRPNPLWAGLAGLLLTALAGAVGVLVCRPGRVSSGQLPS